MGPALPGGLPEQGQQAYQENSQPDTSKKESLHSRVSRPLRQF